MVPEGGVVTVVAEATTSRLAHVFCDSDHARRQSRVYHSFSTTKTTTQTTEVF